MKGIASARVCNYRQLLLAAAAAPFVNKSPATTVYSLSPPMFFFFRTHVFFRCVLVCSTYAALPGTRIKKNVLAKKRRSVLQNVDQTNVATFPCVVACPGVGKLKKSAKISRGLNVGP